MRLYRSGQLIRPDLAAYISSAALMNNLNALRSLTSEPTAFCAVVKANAYGHGIAEIVNLLKNEVDYFAVASIYEAMHISYIVEHQPILILEPMNPSQSSEQIITAAEQGFHCTLSNVESLNFAGNILKDTGLELNVHVNIETGMGRAGLDHQSAIKAVKMIDDSDNFNLAGVFTHFANADEEDLSYVYTQLENFNKFLQVCPQARRDGVKIHTANSAATIKVPQSHFNMVRCGISLYGYFSRPMHQPPIQLKPVMRLTAPIVNLKKLPPGHSVSYGCSFKTERETLIAMVPLGYADGYWRCFSNKAQMKIVDHYAPVTGRVCMDQILLDVTDIDDVHIGQTVTIIDDEHDSRCGAYRLAQLADTICYEILTSVHAHVNRVVY